MKLNEIIFVWYYIRFLFEINYGTVFFSLNAK